MENLNIGVFYGSDSGNTKKVAKMIAAKLGKTAKDIADTDPDELETFDLLILGTPTVNSGELQSDWDYVLDDIEDLDLSNTRVALFGLGDQMEYGDSFLDAMLDIYEACEEADAKIIGEWSTTGYNHTDSRAENDGHFIGLALDMDRQPELTESRVDKWLEQLRHSV
jgi:flavodoxin I